MSDRFCDYYIVMSCGLTHDHREWRLCLFLLIASFLPPATLIKTNVRKSTGISLIMNEQEISSTLSNYVVVFFITSNFIHFILLQILGYFLGALTEWQTGETVHDNQI